MKPIRDTKLGQWLKEKAPKILDTVGNALPDSGVLGIIKNLIDSEPDLTPEMKLEFQKLAAEVDAEYLKDMQNARQAAVDIQALPNASWLSKNTGYILDFVFTAAFIIMLLIIFYRAVPDNNKELFYMAFGALTTYVGSTVNFHRGTSKGSEDKQKLIERLPGRR